MSASAPRALIIVNDIESGPRRIIQWLIDEEVDFDLRVGANGTMPSVEELRTYDGLIMLGGGYMPDDFAGAPWLEPETELVRDVLETGQPTLGICLGGQLLAHVAGGTVRAQYGTPEKGSTAIDMNAEAGSDPVFSQVPAHARFIESHVDQISELPSHAVLLASSADVDNQAFRLGDNAWGLQFHPEAGADSVENWNAEKLAELGFDKDTVLAEARAAQPQTEIDAQALVKAFIARIKAHAARR